MTTEPTYEQRRAKDAREAAEILQEQAPRTPAEQAAINVLDERRWVLHHANDYSLGVIRLLSLRGLLRDIEAEKRQAKADRFWTDHATQVRAADRTAISQLDAIVEQAADQLDAGTDPAKVAKWLRASQGAVSRARENASRSAGSTETTP